jgi:WD40 repeat protein
MCPQSRLAVLLLLGLGGLSFASPKPDRFGDSLPDGAVARLGSLRLRNDAPIRSAVFAADGKTLTVYDGASLSFWDPATGKAVRRVAMKKMPQLRLSHLCADGKTLIASDLNNLLHIYDAATGAEQRTLNRSPNSFLQAFEASPDGKIVVAVCGASIDIWDTKTGKILHELKGAPWAPYAPLHHLMALTADGKRLVLPHADLSLHLLDTATGKELRAFEMPPLPPGRHPSQRLQRLALSPDGRYLVYGGPATPLTLCETATGKRLRELAPAQGILSGLAFTPNGRFIAVGEYTRIRLFGVLSGKVIRTFPVAATASHILAFAPDGRTLATLGGGCAINLWDAIGERPLHPSLGHEGAIEALAFFPDGKRLVALDTNRGMMVWHIASERKLAQLQNNSPAVSLTVDDDGETVQFGGYDVALHRWHPGSGRQERQNVVVGLSTSGLALSPDGRSMAVVRIGRGRELRLYDLKANKSVALPGLPEQTGVWLMAFAPDSRRLAAACYDRALRLWDRDTGRLVRAFKADPTVPFTTKLAFAADGRSLASFDGKVRIRDIAGGRDRLQIIPPANSLFSLAYSPDARFLAWGQTDGVILVYSAVSGKELARWPGKQGAVRSLAFSADARFLASGGDNGTILIWKVPKEEPLPAVLKEKELLALWQTLRDTDAAAASRALAALTAAPAQTIALFKERIRLPGKTLDRAQLARWIEELDDDAFKVRERATRRLSEAGVEAAVALRQTLINDPSPEVRRRVEMLLKRLNEEGDVERLRGFRALEVLERIGTPAAQELLRQLDGKAPSEEFHAEIEASLRRLDKRRKAAAEKSPTP